MLLLNKPADYYCDYCDPQTTILIVSDCTSLSISYYRVYSYDIVDVFTKLSQIVSAPQNPRACYLSIVRGGILRDTLSLRNYRSVALTAKQKKDWLASCLDTTVVQINVTKKEAAAQKKLNAEIEKKRKKHDREQKKIAAQNRKEQRAIERLRKQQEKIAAEKEKVKEKATEKRKISKTKKQENAKKVLEFFNGI